MDNFENAVGAYTPPMKDFYFEHVLRERLSRVQERKVEKEYQDDNT